MLLRERLGRTIARGYSNDLRLRAVAIFQDGESAREAGRLLKVGASTAIRGIERWTKTGSVEAKPGRGHTRSPLKRHERWLLELVATEPDLTLEKSCEQHHGRSGRLGDLSRPEMMVGVAWGDEFCEAVRAEGAL